MLMPLFLLGRDAAASSPSPNIARDIDPAFCRTENERRTRHARDSKAYRHQAC